MTQKLKFGRLRGSYASAFCLQDKAQMTSESSFLAGRGEDPRIALVVHGLNKTYVSGR